MSGGNDSELQTLALSPSTPTSPAEAADVSSFSLLQKHHHSKSHKPWKKHHHKKHESSSKEFRHKPSDAPDVVISVQEPQGKHHHTLIQSTSVDVTPKRRTERMLSAPGTTILSPPTVIPPDRASFQAVPGHTSCTQLAEEPSVDQQAVSGMGGGASESPQPMSLSPSQQAGGTGTHDIQHTEAMHLFPLPLDSSPTTDKIELEQMTGPFSIFSSENNNYSRLATRSPSSANNFMTRSQECYSPVSRPAASSSPRHASPTAPRLSDTQQPDTFRLPDISDDDLLPAVTVHNTLIDPKAVKLHSLQSNITLHIKPEAIRRQSQKPPHSVVQIPENSPDKLKSSRNSKDYQYSSITPSSPTSPKSISDKYIHKGCEYTSVNIDSVNRPEQKATSFLTKFLSQPSHSERKSSEVDFFSDPNFDKNTLKPYGSVIALAGSNCSNSDSTSDASDSSNLVSKKTKGNKSFSTGNRFLQLIGRITPTVTKESPSIAQRKRNNSIPSYSDDNSVFDEDGDVKHPLKVVSHKPADNITTIPDVSIDDDEAWFDSVTKLSEMWFKSNSNLQSNDEILNSQRGHKHDISLSTPVGKSTVGQHFQIRALNTGSEPGGRDSHSLPMTSVGPHKALPSIPQSNTTPFNIRTMRNTNSISSSNTTSNVPASIPGSSKANASSLHRALHQRGLYRGRPIKKPQPIVTLNIDDSGAVKEIEAGLLHLMEEFQAGNLTAFGQDSRLRQMEEIREQQESLMRLHQDVGVRQDLYQPLSTEGLQNNSEQMSTLMEKLACLSEAIDRLQDNASEKKIYKESNEENKIIDNEDDGTEAVDAMEEHTQNELSGNILNVVSDVVRSKSANRVAPRKINSNRLSVDVDSESAEIKNQSLNDAIDGHVLRKAARNIRSESAEGNVIPNINYGKSLNDDASLNVLPMKQLRHVATDGHKSYIVESKHGSVDQETRLSRGNSEGRKQGTAAVHGVQHKTKFSGKEESKAKLRRSNRSSESPLGLNLHEGKTEIFVQDETEHRNSKIKDRKRRGHSHPLSEQQPPEVLPRCHVETEVKTIRRQHSEEDRKRHKHRAAPALPARPPPTFRPPSSTTPAC